MPESSARTLPTYGTDKPSGKGIGPRSSNRSSDDVNTLSLEDMIESICELRISIPDEEANGWGALG
jgi:hypothetical protein